MREIAGGPSTVRRVGCVLVDVGLTSRFESMMMVKIKDDADALTIKRR